MLVSAATHNKGESDRNNKKDGTMQFAMCLKKNRFLTIALVCTTVFAITAKFTTSSAEVSSEPLIYVGGDDESL